MLACAQIPDVAAQTVSATTATVVLESPDELTPALTQRGSGCGNYPDDDNGGAANTCTTVAAVGTNRSTSFGEYITISYTPLVWIRI